MNVTIFEDNSYNSLFPLNINRASFVLRCGAFTNLDRILNNINQSEFDAIWLRLFISKVPAVVKIKIIPARKKSSPNLVIQKAMVEDLIASESLFQKPIKK